MNKTILVSILLLTYALSCSGSSCDTTIETSIKSEINGHQYRISINHIKPIITDSTDHSKPHLLIYLDAGLKFGNHFAEITENTQNTKYHPNIVLVGIAHMEPFHAARRRDFIPPMNSNDTVENFGHADQFYLVLVKEIIPKINKEFNLGFKSLSLAGHSLSGAFAVYAGLQTDNPFEYIAAYSPSLWVQHKLIISDYKKQFQSKSTNTLTILITYGGLELHNKIRSGALELKSLQVQYPNSEVHLLFNKKSFKLHNNYLKKSIRELLFGKPIELCQT
jgi:predicted alpha/beta superfamily hydrolase